MRNLKSQIAFGPFIIAGTVLAFLFGRPFLMSSGFYYLL
jgi:prepilin signal peptidase PulO-like enzyme (type II secretory pathway)